MSVHLSASNNLAVTGRIFMKSDIWVFLKNWYRKLKADKNNTHFPWIPTYIYDTISVSSF